MHRVLIAAVLFTLTIFPSWASAKETGRKSPQATITVYNDAAVPPTVLQRAEQRAESIFARANFEVAWVNCPQASREDARACNRIDQPGHLALRIIPDAAGSVSDVALGVAFLSHDGTGRYCDVFWKRAEDLHAISNLDLGGVVGSVMAHEIGHLLLGTNAHSVSGLMRAHWEDEELRRIAMGNLWFLPQQANLMRGKARRWKSAEQSMERKSPTSSKYETSDLSGAALSILF
jgi:hypothetical protein